MGKGSGLGLSVVHGIVSGLGGVIEVQSWASGSNTGTEFRVFLPLVKNNLTAVILLIVSAIVTPTVDPVTQTLMAAPLYILYELCIWMVWGMERRSKAA